MDAHRNLPNQPNQTFGSSPDRVNNPNFNDTASTAGATNKQKKGGFLNLFGGSNKKANNEEAASPTQTPLNPEKEKEKEKKARNKIVNKKNISDGRIRLNILDNDRVPEDFQIEYRDNPFEMLDHNPVRTTSYIENIKNRDFSIINNREVKRFFENQQNVKEIVPHAAVNNLELDLIDVQDSYEKIFSKFYRFFQGLLPGFLALHIFLVFGGTSNYLTIMNGYKLNCLRINQVFYVVAMISALGALHRYIETKIKYMNSSAASPFVKDALSKQVWKYLISSLCYSFTYIILVYCRRYVSKLSNAIDDDGVQVLSDEFSVFRILNVVIAALTMLGWFCLSLAFEEIGTMQTEMAQYNNDLTREGEELESP